MTKQCICAHKTQANESTWDYHARTGIENCTCECDFCVISRVASESAQKTETTRKCNWCDREATHALGGVGVLACAVHEREHWSTYGYSTTRLSSTTPCPNAVPRLLTREDVKPPPDRVQRPSCVGGVSDMYAKYGGKPKKYVLVHEHGEGSRDGYVFREALRPEFGHSGVSPRADEACYRAMSQDNTFQILEFDSQAERDAWAREEEVDKSPTT